MIPRWGQAFEGPADGAALPRPKAELHGVATDRNGNLKSVSIHALSGPWRNWFLRVHVYYFGTGLTGDTMPAFHLEAGRSAGKERIMERSTG